MRNAVSSVSSATSSLRSVHIIRAQRLCQLLSLQVDVDTRYKFRLIKLRTRFAQRIDSIDQMEAGIPCECKASLLNPSIGEIDVNGILAKKVYQANEGTG